jgi:hypothetical protein
MGLRSPITGLPHGIWPPSDSRTPNGPSSCALRSRAVIASTSALAAAITSGSTSVRIVASISSLTDSVNGPNTLRSRSTSSPLRFCTVNSTMNALEHVLAAVSNHRPTGASPTSSWRITGRAQAMSSS